MKPFLPCHTHVYDQYHRSYIFVSWGLFVVKRRLIWRDPSDLFQRRCGTIKILPCSKAAGAKRRSLTTMATTLYKRNILGQDVKQQTNKYNKTKNLYIPLVPLLLSTSPMACVIFSIVGMNKRRIASCEKRSMPNRVHWTSLSPYFLTAWSIVPN